MNLQSNCSQTSIYAIAQRFNRVNRAMNLVRIMKLHIVSRSLRVITYYMYVLKIIFYHVCALHMQMKTMNCLTNCMF